MMKINVIILRIIIKVSLQRPDFIVLQMVKLNKKAVLSQGNRAMPQLFFLALKFADSINYKFKSGQATKAMLQSSKHTDTKQNLTQNSDSRSFKVTCFGVSGNAIRH